MVLPKLNLAYDMDLPKTMHLSQLSPNKNKVEKINHDKKNISLNSLLPGYPADWSLNLSCLLTRKQSYMDI